MLHGIRDLGDDADGFVDRQPLLPVEPVPQGLPGDVGHDVVHAALGLAGIVQLEDVRMVQVGGGPDLREEPFRADHRCQMGLQELDGDLAMVPDVLRQVDGRHTSLADGPLDPVAAGQGLVQGFNR
jgi:hypothetical protein